MTRVGPARDRGRYAAILGTETSSRGDGVGIRPAWTGANVLALANRATRTDPVLMAPRIRSASSWCPELGLFVEGDDLHFQSLGTLLERGVRLRGLQAHEVAGGGEA